MRLAVACSDRKIYLFDEKMNLNQGRHIFKLIKQYTKKNQSKINNACDEESELELDDIGKEIEKGAKEVQKGVENGVKEVKKGVENGAKEVQKRS